MFGKLKKLFSPAHDDSVMPLHFKDSHAAFEYACAFLQSELMAKAVLPALVEDAKSLLGADEPVVVMPDGTQMLALRVCSRDGGFLVLAGALSANGPRLKVGDLVAWQAGEAIERESPDLQKDQRSKWIGIALAKLKPEYTPGHGWAIEAPFRS